MPNYGAFYNWPLLGDLDIIRAIWNPGKNFVGLRFLIYVPKLHLVSEWYFVCVTFDLDVDLKTIQKHQSGNGYIMAKWTRYAERCVMCT